jgi:hypothetical protein
VDLAGLGLELEVASNVLMLLLADLLEEVLSLVIKETFLLLLL